MVEGSLAYLWLSGSAAGREFGGILILGQGVSFPLQGACDLVCVHYDAASVMRVSFVLTLLGVIVERHHCKSYW